jgi:endonuclease-8
MPEGDTVYKLAAYLGEHLAGQQVLHGYARLDRSLDTMDLAGRRVAAVDSHGKHLYLLFEDGCRLRSHLGLHGSWHAYEPSQRWRKSRRMASIVIDTGRRVFVCFNALQVEWLREGSVRQRSLDVLLGPDLMAATPDWQLVLDRARQLGTGDSLIAEVLLDQRIACGIGNVYKSEVLFRHACHPALTLAEHDDETLVALFMTARRLLMRNRFGGPRVTRWSNDGRGRHWVYGRSGKPCLECGVTIASARLGQKPRTTYWCPGCQPRNAK